MVNTFSLHNFPAYRLLHKMDVFADALTVNDYHDVPRNLPLPAAFPVVMRTSRPRAQIHASFMLVFDLTRLATKLGITPLNLIGVCKEWLSAS